MVTTASRSGFAGTPARSPPVLLLLALAATGCASTSHHEVPTRERLERVSAVEVEVLPTATQVRRLSGTEFGAGPPAGSMARIQVSLPRREVVAEALIDAGSCGTSLPFRKPGPGRDRRRSARLTVELESVNLATGDGPDPLTALWIEVRSKVQLPDHQRDPGSMLHRAADPRPRPLSEWVAGDGAQLRAAVFLLGAGLAPGLVADLGGGKPVKPCEWNLDAPAAGSAAREVAASAHPEAVPPGETSEETPEVAPSEAAPPGERPPAQVPTDIATLQQTSPAGLKVLAALGGGVAGVLVGSFYGLGACAKVIGGGGGGIGLILFAACSVVAVPVGAVAGTAVGMAKGVSYVGERDAAATLAAAGANQGLASRLATAVPPAWMASVLARANQGLSASRPGDGAAVTLEVGMVRLVEERGEVRVARLEVEAILQPGGDPPGPGRRLCLRGPGPVPTDLWFRDDATLLLRSIEGNVARAVAKAVSGLAPLPGDGPCSGRESPPDELKPTEPKETESPWLTQQPNPST